MSKSASPSQHHWRYPIYLGVQVTFPFLSFFAGGGWVSVGIKMSVCWGLWGFFSSGKAGLKSLVELLPFFPVPRWRGGRKDLQSSLQRPWQTPPPPGITDWPSSKLVPSGREGPWRGRDPVSLPGCQTLGTGDAAELRGSLGQGQNYIFSSLPVAALPESLLALMKSVWKDFLQQGKHTEKSLVLPLSLLLL